MEIRNWFRVEWLHLRVKCWLLCLPLEKRRVVWTKAQVSRRERPTAKGCDASSTRP